MPGTISKWLYTMCFALYCIVSAYAQQDSNLVLSFDFNDHTFNEKNHLLSPAKGVGVNLAQDRFGNERSAVNINGHLHSYLSLGTSPLLKAAKTTISMWVNIVRPVYAGKGFNGNVLYLVKNGPQDDFNDAYAIAFDWSNTSKHNTSKFNAATTKDSLDEAIVISGDHIEWGKWYHLVLTSDDKGMVFYVNGELKGSCKKDFETQFLATDSVMIGHTANKKNSRYTLGTFDDIRIFHRVLSGKEILELYNEPDPNKDRLFFFTVLRWLAAVAGVIVVSFLLVWRRRRALKRAQEKLDLKRRLHEMETRTLKAQMNPHFIFNSLNSIKQFVMLRENDKAELYLTKFAKLIRELLESNMNESLSVSEEEEILRGYLDMESLRFGASFSFSVTVDKAVNALRHIPHLMIQPFVENAIWHGLLTKVGERNLWIKFEYDTDKTICCIIEDNGVGRKNRQKKSETFKKKSLALSLVNQRLELMKKNLNVNCGVQVIDKENNAGESLGTKVIIILPYLTNE